ncbi:MAG: hypothetical protein KGH59_04685 [Candidatus Micrarchaeota archaeon]|nr:hypothetical protein [Candidatus Micrarchaeota archaeon]
MPDEDIEDMMKQAKGEDRGPKTPEEKVLGERIDTDESGTPITREGKKPKPSNRFMVMSIIGIIITLGIVALFLSFLFPKAPPPITAPQSGTGCVAYPGFKCANLTMSNNGNVSFLFSQTSGSYYYNVALTCAANITAMAAPNVSKLMVAVLPSGAASAEPPSTIRLPGLSLYLSSAQNAHVTGLKCFNQYALPLEGIAHNFSGAIWVNYTYNNAPIGQSNPMYTAEAGVFRID